MKETRYCTEDGTEVCTVTRQDPGIDWEQRRYELVKSAIAGILANPQWEKQSSLGYYKENVVGNALSYADEAIRQLKNIPMPSDGTQD